MRARGLRAYRPAYPLRGPGGRVSLAAKNGSPR